MELPPEEPIKKKRGRKKKSEIAATETSPTQEEPVVKKRGRKPKGGKLLTKQADNLDEQNSVANVILHLKCSMEDLSLHNDNISQYLNDPLEYNPIAPPVVLNYEDTNNNFSIYDSITNQNAAHTDLN